MSVLEGLTEDEKYLIAILEDESGVDQAEFLWHDETRDDGVFRCYDYQVAWYRAQDKFQIDQCFPAGSLVLTGRGQVPIEGVQVGDQVLTHEGRWRPVTAVFDRGEQDLVSVRGNGHYGLRTTSDHELYVRKYRRRRKVELDQPVWAPVGGLETGAEAHHKWATPRVVDPVPLPVIEGAYHAGQQNSLRDEHLDNIYLWFLVGLYVAEGSVSSSFGHGGGINRVTFSVNNAEVPAVTSALEMVGFRFRSWVNDNVTNIVVNSTTLARWLVEMCGRGAGEKFLHPSIFSQCPKARGAVLDGMVFGDGHRRPRKWDGVRWRGGDTSYTTVSRRLAFDLRILAATLDIQASVAVAREAGEGNILGRSVNLKECYAVSLNESPAKRRAIFLGDHSWSRVLDVQPVGRAKAYDLEVAEDHSYVVEGVVAHNCARAVGKSVGIQLRAFAFGFNYPGEEMLITAPELIHLDPVTRYIEDRLLAVRLSREMLAADSKTSGIRHRPFEVKYKNGSKIVGRIPQKDGKGIKGSSVHGSVVNVPGGTRLIQDLEVGDLVLTHEGRYKPIAHIWSYEADCVEVAGAGHRGLVVSENHRFYGRRNSNPQRTRNLSKPTWLPVDDEDLGERWYWASPTWFPAAPLPVMPDVDVRSFMWLVGRWVADGVVQGKGLSSAAIIVKEEAFDELSAMVALAGYEPRRAPHGNAACVRFYAPEFTSFVLEHFGKRAEGKRIPGWLFGASKVARDAFLEGYLSGDGHWNEAKRRWQASTASKELAVGLKLLGQSLDYSSSLSWVDPKQTHVRGVELKAPAQRSWRVHLKERGRGVFDEHLVWQKIRAVRPAGVRIVYDLVVEEDFSYVADGIVHKGSSQVPVTQEV